MAPELAQLEALVTSKADVFSFGKVLQEMALQSYPCTAEHLAHCRQDQAAAEVQLNAELAAGPVPVPSHWGNTVQWTIACCCQADAQDRPGPRAIMGQCYTALAAALIDAEDPRSVHQYLGLAA